ncbi:MAG: hypothetical protein ABJM43_11635 [Paracoccaceae bacterium]
MSKLPDPEEFNITVRDESLPRTEIVEVLLKLTSYRLTARELISERVQAECDERLLNDAGVLSRLIQPGPKEAALNGKKQSVFANPKRQISVALSAFENNGFVLLVDDRQVETLDEEIELSASSVVTFLKLTPLVGG